MTSKDINLLFKEKGLTLGSAESFTGGLFASEITKVPGASKIYKGGLVTYATEEKVNVLKVEENVLKKYGVISGQCALEMAQKAKSLLNVDVAISFTGNAGPDVMENKPVGEIYIGVSTNVDTYVNKYNLKGNREKIQKQGVELGYEMLFDIISKNL